MRDLVEPKLNQKAAESLNFINFLISKCFQLFSVKCLCRSHQSEENAAENFKKNWLFELRMETSKRRLLNIYERQQLLHVCWISHFVRPQLTQRWKMDTMSSLSVYESDFRPFFVSFSFYIPSSALHITHATTNTFELLTLFHVCSLLEKPNYFPCARKRYATPRRRNSRERSMHAVVDFCDVSIKHTLDSYWMCEGIVFFFG